MWYRLSCTCTTYNYSCSYHVVGGRARASERPKKRDKHEWNIDNTSPERGLIRCSMLIRVNREGRFRIVIPLVVAIKEPTQPDDLVAQIEHNNLHVDLKIVLEQLQDLLARPESLCASRDEHVALKAEGLQRIDHLAEFGAPCEDTQLTARQSVNDYPDAPMIAGSLTCPYCLYFA